MSIQSRSRHPKLSNPQSKPIYPGRYIHGIPFKGPSQTNDQDRHAGSSGTTGRKAHRGPFFKPTYQVYGYRNESDYLAGHHDVVNKQRLERGSERNQQYAESRALDLFR